MKKTYLCLCIFCGTVLLFAGCGRKGDPIIPVIPQPLPVQNVSASIEDGAITLSWAPPATYNTGKPLELKDIKTITVFRKTETPLDNSWEFSQSSEGWSVAGKTFPIKWHKGVLRTASKQKNAVMIAPKGLAIKAENTRYIRLKFWSKNSDRGYIAFITKADNAWDIDRDLTFYPAVYTSFYSYRNAFNPIKLKSFQISPEHTEIRGDLAYEYLIDMKDVPSWQGDIDQIGVVLHNTDPENALVELGLDRVELVDTLEQKSSLYESSPWLFLEDEEGWTSNSPGVVFGETGGVLYARGAEPFVLMSAPGQNIDLESIRQIQIRMQVTTGDKAYLVLRRTQDQPFPRGIRDVANLPGLNIVEFSLTDHTEFQTYTIAGKHLTETVRPDASRKKELISQVAIFFPALAEQSNRRVLIDYVNILEASSETELPRPSFPQKNVPPIDEIEQHVRQRMRMADPDFNLSYPDLPSEKELANDKPIKVAEISPKDPAPAVIKDGKFSLTDTGKFSEDNVGDVSLNYGERYTYTVELTDRKQQKSAQPGSVTIGLTRVPTAPYPLKAEPGDGIIRLTWNRPFLTVDEKKIQSFAGYNIFRSLEPGRYPPTPIYRASPYDMMFTDKNLTNETTYYYTVQAVTLTTPDVYVGSFSPEVSATPIDNVPPAVPTGVVGVYSRDVVNIYWNLVRAEDFAGFNIYRRDDPVGAFRRLNFQPILQASYRDTAVEANKIYYYYVTAFDDTVPPNESQPSEVAVMETITFE